MYLWKQKIIDYPFVYKLNKIQGTKLDAIKLFYGGRAKVLFSYILHGLVSRLPLYSNNGSVSMTRVASPQHWRAAAGIDSHYDSSMTFVKHRGASCETGCSGEHPQNKDRPQQTWHWCMDWIVFLYWQLKRVGNSTASQRDEKVDWFVRV